MKALRLGRTTRLQDLTHALRNYVTIDSAPNVLRNVLPDVLPDAVAADGF